VELAFLRNRMQLVRSRGIMAASVSTTPAFEFGKPKLTMSRPATRWSWRWILPYLRRSSQAVKQEDSVATAYTDLVNAILERFLKESGFKVSSIQGLKLIRATNAISQSQLLDSEWTLSWRPRTRKRC
jgi:arylmalonate decarboxylase-like protein